MEYIPNAIKFVTQSMFVNHKCSIWNCGSWPEIKNLGICGLRIAMGQAFMKFDTEQTKHANYEYNTCQCL